MKLKKPVKIILWILAFLILLMGIFFTAGYFYYSKIIRNYLTGMITRESKGIYHAEIGNLTLNLLAGNLTVRDFTLTPDTARYRELAASDTLAPMLFGIRIDRFRIRDLDVMDAVKNREIRISKILLANPAITVYRMKMTPKAKEEKHKEKMMAIPLPKGLNAIDIREFNVENARVDFIDLSQDSIRRDTFPACNILISGILVDSVHVGKHRLFNADDIRIVLGKYSRDTKNGMNRITFDEIGLSTGAAECWVKGFHLTPLYSKHDYTRKLGFQTDWLDIGIGTLTFHRIDFRKLLFEGKLQAGLLKIDSLSVVDYRDKRVPRKPGFRPAMPQDGIRKLKTYLRIDTVMLAGGKAVYEEQVKEEPGTIFFDKMEATLVGLTNDSVLLNAGHVMVLKGTAWMMGKGKLDATFRFKLGDPGNAFTFTALMGEVDLTGINPMLSKLLPARVVSGKLKKLYVPHVEANDDVATGKLLFYYNDLSVEVIDKEQTTWTKIKTGVINFAANDLVVNNNNPTESGKMKTGVIHFTRDKEKGIINFLWKSALSGLKSTMGFNSKAQKAILKEEKATVKEEKKAAKKAEKKSGKKK